MSARLIAVAAAAAAALALALATLGLGPAAPTAGAATGSGVTAAAEAYLLAAENPDGGFGPAPGEPSNQLFTGWVALGLASAGVDLARVQHGGGTLLGYIRSGGGGGGDVGSVERTILVAVAAGLDPRSFGGRDLVSALQAHIRRDGSVSDQVNLTAFAVLALRAARATPPARTLAWLARQQDSDGGFSFAHAGDSSDADDTGAALEALGGGWPGPAAARDRARAITFLRAQQNRDGGFPSQPGGESNAQSTAWAIQGLVAAGVSPDGLRRGGASPVGYLTSLAAGNGSIRYARGLSQTPVWVTGEALMALEGRALPLRAPAAAPPAPVSSAPAPSAAAPHRPTTHPHAAGPVPPATPRPRAVHLRHVHPRRAAPHAAIVASAASGAVAGRVVAAVGLISALALAPMGV